MPTSSTLQGSLVLMFDVDEHTRGFGGDKRYFEGPNAPDDVASVMIGYPGMDKLVIGGRGLHRAKLHAHGVASHSGGSKTTPAAIEKAAYPTHQLSTVEILDGVSPELPLPGKLTVTAIQSGDGFSITPDLCTVNVDIRTTPTFYDDAASRLLEQLVTLRRRRLARYAGPRSSSSTPAGPPTHSPRTPGCVLLS